jgi:hypothetical protein
MKSHVLADNLHVSWTALYDAVERRGHVRFESPLPLHIRLLLRPRPNSSFAEAIDVSSEGVCFISDIDLMVGEPIQITLPMPEEITGAPEEMRCYSGRVVHVRPVGDCQLVVGVQFIFFESV